MATREAQDGLSRIHDSPIHYNEAAILIFDPQEPQVLCRSDLSNRWPDFMKGELLDLVHALGCGVQAELLEEAQLIWDLADELEGGHMINMQRAAVGAQQQLVVCCPDPGEDNSFLRYGAHKFALLVQNQHLPILSEDQEEACELRDLD